MSADRIRIETMLRAGTELRVIATLIGCTERTLKREIERGTWLRRDGKTWEDIATYSYDVAERRSRESAKNKGRYPKLNDCSELRAFLEEKIRGEKYSPAAALKAAEEAGHEVPICVKTLYNAIDAGELGISRADLPRGRAPKRGKQKPKQARKCLDCARIDSRPQEANERSTFGHWEMDLIVSCRGGKHALLTLTERMTRREVIIRLPDRT
jgi:IS30 family transposase